MPAVTFITHTGTIHTLEATPGTTLMQLAADHGLEEIAAECGGAGSCGTCHCYIEETWQDRVNPATETEIYMLECVLEPRASSRLSCQVVVTGELDGLIVHLPAAQF